MNISIKALSVVLLSVLLISMTQMAHADSKKKLLKRIGEAKITLAQAIKIAEAHQGGRAYEAELEDSSFSMEYEVKLMNNKRRIKITVDGVTSEIKRVRERD